MTQQLRIADEDLHLTDLWRVIAKRKWVLLSSWLLAGILAAIYVFSAQPVYRSKATLLPPTMKDVQGLSVSVPGVIEVRHTPEIVYKAFTRNLKSLGLQKEFFEKHDLIRHYASDEPGRAINVDKLFKNNFSANLDIQHGKLDNEMLEIGFEHPDPNLAAEWLNQYIDFVNQNTVRQFYLDVQSNLQAEVERARARILSKRTVYLERKNDEIARLQEALQIARTLGIQGAGALAGSAGESAIPLVINAAQLPLYMRGEQALENEIAVLNAREADDAFIAGLRDIQEDLAVLKALSIDTAKISAITKDVAPQIPWKAVKPKKVLAFVLAFMVATLLGLCAVFVMESLSRVHTEPD